MYIIFKIFNIYYILLISQPVPFLQITSYTSPNLERFQDNHAQEDIEKPVRWCARKYDPLGTSLHVKGGSSFVHAVDRQDPMGMFPCRHVWQDCNRRSTRPLHETSLSRSSLSRESNETS